MLTWHVFRTIVHTDCCVASAPCKLGRNLNTLELHAGTLLSRDVAADSSSKTRAIQEDVLMLIRSTKSLKSTSKSAGQNSTMTGLYG